ncbi:MAG: thioredoxin [Thermodesulfobacteriota bacterium]|nr:thioredoxin [Thermodesulfobacteriota bacterium]
MSIKKLASKSELDNAINNGVTLVDFNASWCAPCRAQGPIIQRLADEFVGKAVIAETDVDENRESATAYKIQSIPTLVLFKDGSEVERFVGLQSQETLSNMIEKVV